MTERPTVLHVVHPWGAPSETFIRELLRAAETTLPLVATGAVEGPTAGFDVSVVGRRIASSGSSWSHRLRIAELCGLVVRRRAALVHAHFLRWAPLAARAARLTRRPFVLSLHGHVLLVEARSGGPELDVIRSADRVIVPSPFLADHASAVGVSASAIRVIPSGLDLSKTEMRPRSAPPDGAAPLVVCVGRFVEKKGFLDAVDAMAATTTPLRARFVGYGPLESDLRHRIERSGVAAEVVDGRVPGNVAAAFGDAHLVLTPSRRGADGDAETLCVVSLEAQAHGIPVVATDHGGIPFAARGGGALIVPEGDVPALARAIDTVLGDPKQWGPMGVAGRANVEERFDLRRRAAEIEAVYAELTGPAR